MSQYNVRVLPDTLELPNSTEFYDYRGATHVHSSKGFGSGTYQDIITDAQNADLDYLIFTDFNVFERNESTEGYQRQLLVMLGGSFSYLDSRILIYDVHTHRQLTSLGQVQVLLADMLSQKGRDADQDLLVLAHPFKPGFSWTGPYPSGLDGLEIINLKSVWQKAWRNSKASFFWSVLVYPFNLELALLRLYEEPKEELQLWDKLNTQQKTIGFAGNDASARTGSVGDFYFKFPSYEVAFELLSNHVLLTSELTGEAAGDRRKVMEALTAGQFYLSLDVLGNPKGFSAFIEDRDKIIPMGAKIRFHNGQRLKVRLPQKPRVPFEIAFYKGGELLMSSNSRETEYHIPGPGVYRVVVRVIPTMPLPDGKRWISWIYTNPFYVE